MLNIKTKINKEVENIKEAFMPIKLTLIFGLILFLFFTFNGAPAPVGEKPIGVIKEEQALIEQQGATPVVGTKEPNYADCMNVADLANRKICLEAALKIKK